jgi:hypothetical protein
MSDRGLLFLFSLLVVVVSLGAAGWLLATGQAASVDGLFLLLTCLLLALSFSLYLVFLVRRAIVRPEKAAPQAAKAAAPRQPQPAPTSSPAQSS